MDTRSWKRFVSSIELPQYLIVSPVFADRMLAGTEKILPLLRKRLEMAGYDDDELTNIAGEDLGHIFRLIVRDLSWRPDVSISLVVGPVLEH
jgi:hypothetical protein